MDLFSIPFFNILRTRMNWLEARQEAIAGNIANANTRGYEAQDVAGVDFGRLVAGASPEAMRQTNVRHMPGTAGAAGAPFKQIDAPDRESTPDGNSVMLEDQMMKLGETQMNHQAAIGLYRKAVEMLRLAVRSA